MSAVEKISIALPPQMVAQLHQAVEAGEYASASEVVRDALLDWTQKRKLQDEGVGELRRLWQEARADKPPGLEPDRVFDALESKYQALVEAQGKVS